MMIIPLYTTTAHEICYGTKSNHLDSIFDYTYNCKVSKHYYLSDLASIRIKRLTNCQNQEEILSIKVSRGLSNTVDQNPVVFPCFPSENRKSSGVKSYQVYWIHWTRIDSNGKVHFLFVRDLEKFRSCWTRGWKVVPMESIGSIGHE